MSCISGLSLVDERVLHAQDPPQEAVNKGRRLIGGQFCHHFDGFRNCDRIGDVLLPQEFVYADAQGGAEIGRASCRERVWVSVGGGVVKEKERKACITWNGYKDEGQHKLRLRVECYG